MRARPLALIFAAFIASPGMAVELAGKIHDLRSLTQVRSFCVETGALSPAEKEDLAKFIEKESRPKKLLAKFAWKHKSACSDADAVIKLEFWQKSRTEYGHRLDANTPMPSPDVTAVYNKVNMAVIGKTSDAPLYSLEGDETRKSRGSAIKSAFEGLQRDLKLLDRPGI